mmetsp:Transcript_57675/g.106628  ORF Transcript_57675/g.106628 Transcript_57675/m.106628 type:complete len:299 (-) Transcript_57675:29-925(-)
MAPNPMTLGAARMHSFGPRLPPPRVSKLGWQRQLIRRHASAPQSRTVTAYLVRHGQSLWNLAAKQWDFRTMLSQVDHPLTAEGVAQARRLREAVSTAAAAGDEDAARFTAAETKVLSSPLTRAVATTVLAVGQDRLIRLVPEARELCYPIGGPDSLGTATGDAIALRVAETLSTVGGKEWLKEPLDSLLDTSAVNERWWGRLIEKRPAMEARMKKLLSKTVLSAAGPEQNDVVLVCHCLVIMRCFKDHAASGFASAQQTWLAELQSKKLENCGVVRVEIGDTGLIEDASLVFGSQLLP